MADDDEQRRAIAEHTAGATVRHKSPFADLKVFVRDEPPDRDFIYRWVLPFYMKNPADEAFRVAYREVAKEVDESLIRHLLSFFNWRPRLVGAYFAAILDTKNTLDVIEPLLLRSDVCDAGRGYCLALARMNAQRSPDILERYLDYYLTKYDLWFDQADALYTPPQSPRCLLRAPQASLSKMLWSAIDPRAD